VPSVSDRFARPKAWFMIYRILAVLLWAQTVVVMGSASALHLTGKFELLNFFLVFAIASLVQGFPAHTLNEIFDWQSGADRYKRLGQKSGGSKVIKAGLADVPQLWTMFWSTTTICLGLLAFLYLRTDATVLIIFLVGFFVTVAYSVPPFRFAYRPFVGEWCGGFTGVVLTFCGSFYVQAGYLELQVVAVALCLGLVYIGIMILFHYLDYEGDRRAVPTKKTTIVYLGPLRSKVYVLAVLALGLVSAIWLMRFMPALFVVLPVLISMHLILHVRCDPFNAESIIRSGKSLTAVTLAAVLVFAVLIKLHFAAMLGLVALSFWLHRRYGKLRQA